MLFCEHFFFFKIQAEGLVLLIKSLASQNGATDGSLALMLLGGLTLLRKPTKDPLTKIDGLNTWHEARLLQEKIDNVQLYKEIE